MALTTHLHYLYPPDYIKGPYQTNVGVLPTGPRRYHVLLQGTGTGTEDETDEHKIILTNHVTQRGEDASRFVIEKIKWEVSGYTGLWLEFDRNTQHRFFSVRGVDSGGERDFTKYGGFTDNGEGGTGDIIITTVGGALYDMYELEIQFRVK